MALNLLELQEEGMVASLAGQKILVYSGNNLGKTYQCSRLPKPLLLMTEAGGNAVRCPKLPVTKWSVFKDIVKQLTNEKTLDQMKEKYSTIVIDTLQNLVELAEAATCTEFGVRDLSEITGKQNGYALYRKDFKNQINKLASYGYTICFIDHEEVVEMEDPVTGEVYNYIQPKGSSNIKSSTRFVRDLCDFCFYLRNLGVNEDGEVIPSMAICKQMKHVFARSRYDIQTYINPFTAKNMEEAITKAIQKSAENEGAELVGWKPKTDNYTAKDWIALLQPYCKAIGKKYPERLVEEIESELGEGNKVSKATDDQLIELENLYNKLNTFACEMGIVVE